MLFLQICSYSESLAMQWEQQCIFTPATSTSAYSLLMTSLQRQKWNNEPRNDKCHWQTQCHLMHVYFNYNGAFIKYLMQKHQKKRRNDNIWHHTHLAHKYTWTHFRKVHIILRAFGLEHMPGGDNKHLQKKSSLCTNEALSYFVSVQNIQCTHDAVCLLPLWKNVFHWFRDLPPCVIPTLVHFQNAKSFA